ncbi:MAG: hypothetical protein CVV25_06820 [Ignavibacteriae bacterium HGW-Ignavibacteriae-4]|jgi:hypothetical protein|nr:MAG: hypothetical protein CVV25_06820 [Ignavibacteriae bacterium HGW-Ignavibacteriae-4]
MSNTPPPSNYQWIGNTLSYTLAPEVVGLKLEYKREGETITHLIFDDKTSAPTSVVLSSSLGPKGTITGITGEGDHSVWGPPGTEEITNQTV